MVFLCLSIFCGLLAFLEGTGPALALYDRDDSMWLPKVRVCPPTPSTTVDQYPWYYDRNPWHDRFYECKWVWPENRDKYYTPLVAMNATILFMAFLHLSLSVWGVVIAAQALHKDSTCLRCCGDCFCCCGECGIEGPITGGVVTSPYQPIQLVVSHQGTLANGEKALVLLPMDGAANVPMSEAQLGPAAVTEGAANKQMNEAQLGSAAFTIGTAETKNQVPTELCATRLLSLLS